MREYTDARLAISVRSPSRFVAKWFRRLRHKRNMPKADKAVVVSSLACDGLKSGLQHSPLGSITVAVA